MLHNKLLECSKSSNSFKFGSNLLQIVAPLYLNDLWPAANAHL